MRRIAKVLKEALPQQEALRQARASRTLKRWPEVVGKMLSEKSWPDRFEKGTVYVAVSGSAWAQELRMKHSAILKRLAELSEEPGLFQDLRFGVRTLPEASAAEADLGPMPKVRQPLTPEEFREKWLVEQEHEEPE